MLSSKSSRKIISNIFAPSADNKHYPLLFRVVLFIFKYKLLPFILALSLVISITPGAYAEMNVATSAQACVLMYKDGRCLYEKNPDEKNLIASTTKIMTAIVTIENSKLDEKVKIKPEYCAVEGSSMYLKAGEIYTVKELLLGLMLASGNDAALALANHVAGGSKEFAVLMNEKAKEIGMVNSGFANPHGLDQKGHYSTARDMARLMLYCMENEQFRAIVSCKSAEIKENVYNNHNKLLALYPCCIGGKTGFTAAAGRCLVSCCEKDGGQLVCVTLSDPDDWQDHIALYNYAFSNYSLRDIASGINYELPLISGNKKSVSLIAGEKLEMFLSNDEQILLEAEIPPFIFAPVKIGETAGKICVIIKNSVVAELPLVFAEDAVAAYPCMSKLKGAL